MQHFESTPHENNPAVRKMLGAAGISRIFGFDSSRVQNYDPHGKHTLRPEMVRMLGQALDHVIDFGYDVPNEGTAPARLDRDNAQLPPSTAMETAPRGDHIAESREGSLAAA